MLDCSEVLDIFVFWNMSVCPGKICYSTFDVKKCRVKQFERGGVKLQINTAQTFMCIMPTKKRWRDAKAVEISLNAKAKIFLSDNSLGVLHDCPEPSGAPQVFVFSSVTVHSLIPISNFSKCASITCWTKWRNTEYVIKHSCVSFKSEYYMCFLCTLRQYVFIAHTIPVAHSHGHVHCVESRVWLYGRISTTLWKTYKNNIIIVQANVWPNNSLNTSVSEYFFPQVLLSVKDLSSPNKISTQRTWFPWTAYSRGAPPFWNPQRAMSQQAKQTFDSSIKCPVQGEWHITLIPLIAFYSIRSWIKA